MPTIFGDTYHQPVGIAGLHYLALGVGLTSASQINARMLDRMYRYFKEKNGGEEWDGSACCGARGWTVTGTG